MILEILRFTLRQALRPGPMHRRRPWTVLALCLFVPALGPMRPAQAQSTAQKSLAPKSEADLFGDELLAEGRGVSVRRSQLEEAFAMFKANLATRGQRLSDDKREVAQTQLLDKLVVTQILMSQATDEDREKAKISGAKFIEQTRKQAPSEEAFKRQLLAVGMTQAQFEAQISERAICEQVLDRALKSKTSVTDAQAKKFYDDNPKRFLQPEAMRVRHLLISTRDLTGRELPEPLRAAKQEAAAKLFERAKKGENFETLVREASDDRSSRERGGEQTFTRGQMPPEFEVAAFALAPNQLSGLVTTFHGFHIIKALERIPEKKIPYSQAEIDIKEKLAFDEVQSLLPEFFEKLKKDYQVTIKKP